MHSTTRMFEEFRPLLSFWTPPSGYPGSSKPSHPEADSRKKCADVFAALQTCVGRGIENNTEHDQVRELCTLLVKSLRCDAHMSADFKDVRRKLANCILYDQERNKYALDKRFSMPFNFGLLSFQAESHADKLRKSTNV